MQMAGDCIESLESLDLLGNLSMSFNRDSYLLQSINLDTNPCVNTALVFIQKTCMMILCTLLPEDYGVIVSSFDLICSRSLPLVMP